MGNVPGVFWVYPSEETNLHEKEQKPVDNKALLNGVSHGQDMRQHRTSMLNELRSSVVGT